MQVINALANEFGNEKNNKRYVETGKYGWIDLKHFFTAAKYGNDYGQWITEGLGWLNELNQYMNEGPNDYKSGFSYEDLPSNSAGADFGRRRWWGGGKVSGALGNWSDGADGVNIGDPGSTYGNLPPTDPNLPKGGGGGSNSSNNNPAGGSNSNSSNPPPPNNTPPKGSTSSCPPQQKPKPKKKNGSNSGSNSSNNGNNANSSSSGS